MQLNHLMRREFIIVLGGAAVWPHALSAQSAMPVIGFLNGASAEGFAHRVAAFRQGLSEAGYVEGQTVAIEFRWADGDYGRLQRLATELLERRVAVLVATGGTAVVRAAIRATSATPIVFTSGGDPVALGLVSSLSRPGGNVTGIGLLTAELVTKRFEVLRELVPKARVIGMIINPAAALGERDAEAIGAVAAAQGMRLQVVRATTEADFVIAFAALVKVGAEAVLVDADPFFESHRQALIALAVGHGLPAIYDTRDYPEAGGLVSYGADFSGAYRQAGLYAGRILGGAKPADLPVIQLKSIELVLNLKAAKALGLAVPSSILVRADEVIE